MIRTLSEPEFNRACMALADNVTNSGFEPDTVIGIANGGDIVARKMLPYFNNNAQYFPVSMHRHGTGMKEGVLSKILKHIPRSMSDFLRMAESRFYALKSLISTPKLRKVSLPSDLCRFLNANDRPKILIIDDAADSGVTLASVKDTVSKSVPDAIVRTAVITRTRKKTLLEPDHTLFPTGTIVRFPWAPDA